MENKAQSAKQSRKQRDILAIQIILADTAIEKYISKILEKYYYPDERPSPELDALEEWAVLMSQKIDSLQ